jgi:carbonic anhydrase
MSPDRDAPASPAEALQRLLDGNARFVSGAPDHEARERARLAEVADTQSPFVVVLACADSRVPAEVVFDQGFGDLFVVRVAGNTAEEPVVVGSIEYGVTQLGCLLVFVLGHSGCGAVQGAVGRVTKGTALPGDIGAVVEPIVPAVEEVVDAGGDVAAAAVVANVRRTMAALGEVETISDLAGRGALAVAGGVYDLRSGKVDTVDEPGGA